MITEIKTVKEITTPLDEYPHIREDEPIGNGVAQLLNHCSTDGRCMYYDEILVINKTHKLVGRLSVKNILISFFPSILSPEPAGLFSGKKPNFTDLSILLEDSFRRECRRQANHLVSEYMTAPHQSISIDTHPLHALEIMVKDGENILPVTENKVLVGAIRMVDIFRLLGNYCTL